MKPRTPLHQGDQREDRHVDQPLHGADVGEPLPREARLDERAHGGEGPGAEEAAEEERREPRADSREGCAFAVSWVVASECCNEDARGHGNSRAPAVTTDCRQGYVRAGPWGPSRWKKSTGVVIEDCPVVVVPSEQVGVIGETVLGSYLSSGRDVGRVGRRPRLRLALQPRARAERHVREEIRAAAHYLHLLAKNRKRRGDHGQLQWRNRRQSSGLVRGEVTIRRPVQL